MKNRVKILRAKHGLIQGNLAKDIGLSRPALDIENSKVIPNGKIVIRIANIFGIPAERIFFEDDVLQEGQDLN